MTTSSPRQRRYRTVFIASVVCLLVGVAHAAERVDRVLADFEGDSYGDWVVAGEAFGERPARGALANQQAVGGFEGAGLVNSYVNGDRTTGSLTSPEFEIDREYLNFLVGGGRLPGETEVQLLVGDRIVRSATGDDDELLAWATFDLRDLAGKRARVRIVDEATGGWGHINVDQITLSDTPRSSGPAERQIVIEHRYLHLPVKARGKTTRMTLSVDGNAVRAFDLVLSDEPDFWVYADVSPWTGKSMTLKAGRGVAGLDLVRADDELPDAAGLYREKLRPRFHFTAPRGWLNDPNGLVYHDGEWHLFYQHNPFGWEWANMHWGHAVSRDLFHWKHLGEAFHPWSDTKGHAFSGSAIVDHRNTAGWKTGDEDVLVASLTDTDLGEVVAYSNDRGRTFNMFEGNPVVRHVGRDPKIVWHAPTKRWVMAVYEELDGKQWITFHTSPDLKTWTFGSRIEGYFECPDLFEIAVDGDPNRTRWVLYGADARYAIGSFDGTTFTPDHAGKHQVWHGDYYAAQSYDNAPDGRRVQIGWGRGIAFPGMPFNQQMAVPVELTLRTTDEGVRMFAEPVRELESLRGEGRVVKQTKLGPDAPNPLAGIDVREAEIVCDIELGDARRLVFNLRGATMVYDADKAELDCVGVRARLKPIDGRLRLRVLIDRGSVECFGNDGRVAISKHHLFDPDRRDLAIYAGGGSARVNEIVVYPIGSVWQD